MTSNSVDRGMQASARRVLHARNRLNWQKRLLADTTDPQMRQIGERMLVTLESIVDTLEETHRLLMERAQSGVPD